VHGEPIRFGAAGERGVMQRPDGHLEVVDVGQAGAANLLVHDAHREDPALAFSLSRLAASPTDPTPIGLFRQVERPVYDNLVQAQLEDATARRGQGDLGALLAGTETWQVD